MINSKKLLLFSDDQKLIELLRNTLPENTLQSYTYDVYLAEISFENSVIMVDYEPENTKLRNFLSDIMEKIDENMKILVISANCDRRVVSEVARKGIDRFIVKPINKKRVKTLLMPYLISDIELSSDNDFVEDVSSLSI